MSRVKLYLSDGLNDRVKDVAIKKVSETVSADHLYK